MNKDLFQISQMNDIYFTMSLWSVLSPDMREDSEITRPSKSGKSSWKRERRHIKPRHKTK